VIRGTPPNIGGVEYVLGTPSRPVCGLLDRAYIGFAQPAGTEERWLATPGTAVTVIINLGAPFGELPQSFAAGLTDTAGVVEQHGKIECVDLKLTPLGAYALLGVPMDELTGRVVDLEELPGFRELTERMAGHSTWDGRFAMVDAFLLDRLDEGPRPADEVAFAWRRLAATRGSLPIGALAEEVGWSRRHLVAKFRQQVGLPPKTIARILRFQHLLGRLRNEPVDLTRLAAECGYYDQSHLNRDFREFAGISPGAYLARMVTNVQYSWVSAA
jgi:AraC-like DNA-binding protein